MRITAYLGLILILLLCHTAHSQRKRRAADPFRQFVMALPPADRVEVEDVAPFLTDDLKSVDCAQANLICAPGRLPLKRGEVKTLTGKDADRLSALWRKLERDYLHTEDKCFTPDQVLRFYRGDKLLLETEVCAFCRKITLPKRGVVNVEGGADEPYDHFREFLIPDSSLKESLERFKREMMPKVGQQMTVIGLFGGLGKPALAVAFGEGEIYIHRMDLAEENRLINLGCSVMVKATGTLRFWPQQPPQKISNMVEQTSPEHFYFDDAEIKVIMVEPWKRSRRRQRTR